MVISSGRTLSWGFSDPSKKQGTIQNIRGIDSSRDFFNSIFVADATTTPARPPIADRILENFKLLRDGNRRLSASDKQRLSDHIDRLAELDRKLNTKGQASCGSINKPTDDASAHQKIDAADAAKHWQLFTDVIAAAFVCGTSRIAVVGVGDTSKFVAYPGDWHQEVAHQWQGAEKQKLLADSYQRFFETVFLDAAAKLDVEEAPGVTYLDNTLDGLVTRMLYGHARLGVDTDRDHGQRRWLFQRPGIFADYRKINGPTSKYDPAAGNVQWLGLLYNQWLANVLLAMGVPPAEFELWGHKGYGDPQLTKETWTPPYAKHYESTTSRYFQMASTALPFLKA